MNKKGITLTEVLVTCCIVAIMGSIAIVNFGSYNDPVEKSQLFQSAKVWSARVKTCILNVGGWKIKRFSKPGDDPCPAGETEPCQVARHCRVGGNSNFANKFKTRLGWDCPVENPQEDSTKAGPGCFPYFSDDDFYCLDIRKEKRGTKYQCIVHFNIKNHREKIYCGTPASYESVSCGDSPTYTNLKEADKNKWPEDSAPSTTTGLGDANMST